MKRHKCPKHGLEYCTNANNDPEKTFLEIHFCTNTVDTLLDSWHDDKIYQ